MRPSAAEWFKLKLYESSGSSKFAPLDECELPVLEYGEVASTDSPPTGLDGWYATACMITLAEVKAETSFRQSGKFYVIASLVISSVLDWESGKRDTSNFGQKSWIHVPLKGFYFFTTIIQSSTKHAKKNSDGATPKINYALTWWTQEHMKPIYVHFTQRN